MKIKLKRIALKKDYTIGKFDNGEKKIYGQTAIPYGTYEVTTNVVSSRFKNRIWAKPYNGKIPRLLNVQSFDGVLLHPGSSQLDTSGCILVGKNTIVGKLTDSQKTFHLLMQKIKNQKNITIEII